MVGVIAAVVGVAAVRPSPSEYMNRPEKPATFGAQYWTALPWRRLKAASDLVFERPLWVVVTGTLNPGVLTRFAASHWNEPRSEPVKMFGTLYGVSHWPATTVPHGPSSPRPVLRVASPLGGSPSTPTALSIWNQTLLPPPSDSKPRKPKLDVLPDIRSRRDWFAPV